VTRVVAGALGTTADGFTAPEYADVGPVASAFLARGKTAAEIDVTGDAGRARLAELVSTADLVIEQLTPARRRLLGEEYARAVAARPDRVVVSITPYGLTGPRSEEAATEIVIDAAGGWLQHVGEPEEGPIRPAGHQSEIMGALAAVTAGLASLIEAEETGRGDVVDLALSECVTWFQMNPTTVYSYSGSIGHRTGGASDVNYPQGVFTCADGLVGINVLYYVEWFHFCDLMERPGWKTDPRLETPLLRYENRAVIDEVLLPWLAARTADEIFAAGQANRLPFGKVSSPAELLRSAQLGSRGFWRQEELHGRSVVLPAVPAVFT
jgi:crotonobetainyl-CoA:carnitine CoA-transferase CaiB-like acyl-CoA transferase